MTGMNEKMRWELDNELKLTFEEVREFLGVFMLMNFNFVVKKVKNFNFIF